MSDKISPLCEPFLHDSLIILIYHHLVGDNFQRFNDSYRGSLIACYSLGLVSNYHFMFLMNFLFWLECKTVFTDSEDDIFRYFYDDLLKDLDNYFFV